MSKNNKSYSEQKQADVQVRGDSLFLRFDHELEEKTDMDGTTRTQWACTEVRVPKQSSRNEIIEAVIRTKYDTYGAELAAINNGGAEHEEYLEFRITAKTLADGVFGE
jgi:hypothetical protein